MEYWQKQRNYRKRRNDDGTVAFIITVDGQDTEVTSEIYRAYSMADRRERYQSERDQGMLLSFDRMAGNETPLWGLSDGHAESAEDAALKRILSEWAMRAFNALAPDERHLIRALIVDGVTEREYAAIAGVSQAAVNKRKGRILKKLQTIFNFDVINLVVFRDGE